jgi:DNA-binding transcriptional ArsR family regulator
MNTDTLTLTFSALADPTRRAILERLATGHAVVKDLVQPFGMSSPAISKHLRVLERAGLVEQGARRSGGRAGCSASRSRRRPTGCSATARSGRRSSTAWMRFSNG